MGGLDKAGKAAVVTQLWLGSQILSSHFWGFFFSFFFNIKHFSNPCPKTQYYICSFEFVLGKKSPKKAHEFITFKYRFLQFKTAECLWKALTALVANAWGKVVFAGPQLFFCLQVRKQRWKHSSQIGSFSNANNPGRNSTSSCCLWSTPSFRVYQLVQVECWELGWLKREFVSLGRTGVVWGHSPGPGSLEPQRSAGFQLG